MKVFQSFRESTLCFILTAIISSVTLVILEKYTEFQDELAIAVLQSGKEDKQRLIAKVCKISVFVLSRRDPIFYV